MESLILHPNSTYEWQTLVSDASQNCNIELNDDIESYLVFLLMRFVNETNLAKKVVAIDYLKSYKKSGSHKELKLRDVGDTCLMFSGFFPERAQKRSVNIGYYVNIGQSAYNNLSNTNNTLSTLYSDLSNNFVSLMDILQTMRKLNTEESLLDPITATELYTETSSKSALKDLNLHLNNKASIITSTNNIKH